MPSPLPSGKRFRQRGAPRAIPKRKAAAAVAVYPARDSNPARTAGIINGDRTARRDDPEKTERMQLESEYIRRARKGDGEAVRELYRRYAPRVYAVVRRLAGDDALAEDWAQEAWVRAIRALPGFRGDARFSTWLHRIAVNSALHGRRWRDRRTRNEVQLPAVLPGARADQTALRLSLEQAMQQLPDGMRQVLVLHDVEGYTHEEIGTFLGVTPGTSKSQLFKARARMRKLLRSAQEFEWRGSMQHLMIETIARLVDERAIA